MSVNLHIRNTTTYPVRGTFSSTDPQYFDVYSVDPQNETYNELPVSQALEISATITRPEGDVEATAYGPTSTSTGSRFKVVESEPGKYAVTLDDVAELAALAQARADLERHWPKNQPLIGHVAQGRLLSSLRTNPAAEHPCVAPTLLAIGREVLPNLSETDADRISQAVVAAVINARFTHSFLSGMHRCESGRQLHWGILIHCEPHPDGKDRVDYQLAIAVSS